MNWKPPLKRFYVKITDLDLPCSPSQTIQFCKNRPRRAPKSEKQNKVFQFSFLYMVRVKYINDLN